MHASKRSRSHSLPSSNPVASTVPCTLCNGLIALDDQSQCLGCGEIICDSCPHFACACLRVNDDDTPGFLAGLVSLRDWALELKRLRGMDAGSLNPYQRDRIIHLTVLVPEMREFMNELDQRNHGMA